MAWTRRPARQRGHTQIEWLDSWHTFSFGDYLDPAHSGFRALRVINEDRVAPGQGFPPHGHRDMEIISYVLGGALEHLDSTGSSSVLRSGEMQLMTAGTGIRHSERNPSLYEPVHFLQIWIEPEQRGLRPGYQQIAAPVENAHGDFRLVVSPDGRNGTLRIARNVQVFQGVALEGQALQYRVGPGRHVWLQVVHGDVSLESLALASGDGAASSDPGNLLVQAGPEGCHLLLFDLD